MKQFNNFEYIVNNLPTKPGVYKFLDINNNVLYVGKAKNLRKRVRSYWSKSSNLSGKLKILLSKINNVEYIITNNENEAFLLENNLIKTLKPRYNVLLKDDKTYPWIKITNEEYPIIIKTRIYTSDNSKYFGPYSSVNLLNTLLDLVHKLFNIRTCKLKLKEDYINKKKFKPCLEYHIGNCKAPCINKISKNEYTQLVNLAENVLKGELKAAYNYITKKMYEHSSNLQFELAQEYKKKLEILQNYQSKSVIVSPKLKNVDVFTFKRQERYFFINYIRVNNGLLVQSQNLILEPQLSENDIEIFVFGIKHIRDAFKSDNDTIIVPIKPKLNFDNIKFIVPKSGEKLKILKFSEANLNTFVHQFNLNKLKANYGNVNVRLLEKLKNELNLSILPVRIECFDISHHSGNQMVASCVVFINGKPAKSEYRHFNIKNVSSIDDYSAIEEIVYRRYARLLEEKKPLPHLIIIDGGKGQLSAALKSLNKLNLTNFEVISIAKRLEEIFKPNENLPVYIDKRSESLRLIQRIRNEAHRFAITFHRNKKLNVSFSSVLDFIPYIGEKTKQKLLEHFSSADSIANADLTTLETIIGKSKAKIIYNFFHNE